ncbi:hypothetical protein ACWDBW_01570 [Streptomyces sp. NPDC001107]
MNGVNVPPSAVTTMAGPQIMSAIALVTTRRAVRVPLAFLAGCRRHRERRRRDHLEPGGPVRPRLLLILLVPSDIAVMPADVRHVTRRG